MSAIIPAYRAQATIARAIESVAGQALRPFELIVVDDASDDSTAAQVRSLAQHYETDWLKLLVMPSNSGAASARNAGWAEARGEFVAFLDADDAWHPYKIALQYGYLRSHPEVDLCGHGFAYQRAATPPTNEDLPLRARRIGKTRMLLKNPFVTPSVMLRCNLPWRFQPGKRHMEDHLLWMEIVLAGRTVTRLDAPLAYLGKAQFGESGLSAALWAMEKGELDNYRHLGTSGKLARPLAWLLMVYSLIKFVRRLLAVGWRRLKAVVGANRMETTS